MRPLFIVAVLSIFGIVPLYAQDLLQAEREWRDALVRDFSAKNLRTTCKDYPAGMTYACYQKRAEKILSQGPISTDGQIVLVNVGLLALNTDYEYLLKFAPAEGALLTYTILETQLQHGLRLCEKPSLPLEQTPQMEVVRKQLARDVLRGNRWEIDNKKYILGLAETKPVQRQKAGRLIRLQGELQKCVGAETAHSFPGLADPPIF